MDERYDDHRRDWYAQHEQCVFYPRGLSHFDANLLGEEYFRRLTRFTRAQFNHFAPLLRLPEYITTRPGYIKDRSTSVTMLLARLALPIRYSDLAKIFRVSSGQICHIIKRTTLMLITTWKRRISTNDVFFRSTGHIIACAFGAQGEADCRSALHPLLLDGTGIKICRPSDGNPAMYSGHHHQYELRFVCACSTDGLCHFVRGPFPGSFNDSRVQRDLRLNDLFGQLLRRANAYFDHPHRVSVYADGGFSLSWTIRTPFRESRENTIHWDRFRAINTRMAMVRQEIERYFGCMKEEFKYLVYSRNLQVSRSAIGNYFYLAVFFTNILRCYHTHVAEKYGVRPFTVEQYLSFWQKSRKQVKWTKAIITELWPYKSILTINFFIYDGMVSEWLAQRA